MRSLGRLVIMVFLGASCMAQAPIQPTFFGMHFNRINSLPVNVPIGSIRLWGTGTGWAHMCPDGPHCDFKRLDNWLAAAKSSGITDVVYTFGKVPAWISANPPDKPHAAEWGVFPPKDLTADGGGSDEAWKNFVKTLVDHNKNLDSRHSKIRYWGIWNEPSAGNFWKGIQAQLVRMAKDAYPIIKAADPGALVLSPELAGIGRLHDDWFDDYIAAGGAPYMDVIAFHGYASAVAGAGDLHDAPDHPHPVPEEVLKAVNHFKEKVSHHPELAGKPLWNSECSWGRTDEANWKDWEQGVAYIFRFYLLQASAGVERVYWYMFDPNDIHACCGAMANTDRSELPTAAAYREMHKWLLGRSVTACAAQGHVWTCNVDGPGFKGKAVWDDEYEKSATYDATGFASYRDVLDASTPLSAKNHMVTIGNKPVLLEAGK